MVIKKTKKRSKQKKKRTYKKKGGYNDGIAYDFNKIAHHWVLLYIETTRKTKKHTNNNNNDYTPKKHTLTYQPNTIHIEHNLGFNYRIDLSNWKYVLDPYEGTITLYEKQIEQNNKKQHKFEHYHDTHDELMKKYKHLMNNIKYTKNYNDKEKLMYEEIAKELHKMVLHYASLQLKKNITNRKLVFKKYTKQQKRDSGVGSSDTENN